MIPSTLGSSSTGSMQTGLIDNEERLDLSSASPPTSFGPRHPFIALSHVGFKLLSIFYFLFCKLFNDSFVTNFVLLLSFVALDFWITKNITGRFLVGLRWWNYVDPSTGKSHWVFEKAPESRVIDKGESSLFWTALIAMPAVWCFFAFTAFFTFSFQWLTIIVVSVSLSSSNLYGYIRCKLGANKSISGTATSWLSMQFFKNMFSRKSPGPQATNVPPSSSFPAPTY